MRQIFCAFVKKSWRKFELSVSSVSGPLEPKLYIIPYENTISNTAKYYCHISDIRGLAVYLWLSDGSVGVCDVSLRKCCRFSVETAWLRIVWGVWDIARIFEYYPQDNNGTQVRVAHG